MGRSGNVSGKVALKAFQKAGWQVIGQVGSHVVLIKSGIRLTLSVPGIRNFPQGHSARLSEMQA